MSIDRLVQVFNERWRAESGMAEGPLRFAGRAVTARIAGIESSTAFDPIRLAEAPALTVAYRARLRSKVSAAPLRATSDSPFSQTEAAAIIRFDRLCRTLHLLNYLNDRNDSYSQLILDVDPRHIISVPRDHGTFFSELLQICNIGAERIVLSTSLHLAAQSGDYLHRLGQGLTNYRNRGYRIAVELNTLPMSKATAHFFFRVAPDYLRADSRVFGGYTRALPTGTSRYLGLMQRLMFGFGGKVILEHIETEEGLMLAKRAGIEWIEGLFLERPRQERRAWPLRAWNSQVREGVYVQAV